MLWFFSIFFIFTMGCFVKKLFPRIFLLCLILFSSLSATAQNSFTPCQITDSTLPIESGVIKYFKVGSGQPLILLHGLFAQKEQWLDFACEMSRRGYAVFAPDLPGYGQSTGFSIESYALNQEVLFIHQFVQNLGLHKPHIVGNSMGGTIAALYSEQYPDDMKSLGFIGAPLGIVDWSQQIKSAILKGINPFIPITVSQFDLEMSLLFYKPPTLSNEVKQSAVNGYVSNNLQYQQIWNIVNLDLMVLDQKKKSMKPTFIAWGMHDGVFNVSGKRFLDERFPNGLSLTISDAAHLIMLENPKEIADQYLTFLNSLPAN